MVNLWAYACIHLMLLSTSFTLHFSISLFHSLQTWLRCHLRQTQRGMNTSLFFQQILNTLKYFLWSKTEASPPRRPKSLLSAGILQLLAIKTTKGVSSVLKGMTWWASFIPHVKKWLQTHKSGTSPWTWPLNGHTLWLQAASWVSHRLRSFYNKLMAKEVCASNNYIQNCFFM